MPPLYDDIVDALLLTADGAEHTVSLTNVDATEETGENAVLNSMPGVWAKVDLSAYPDGWQVDIPMTLDKTGGDAGFEPYVAVLKVIDASWDPSSPDWSKIDWTSQDLGDNTSLVSGTITLLGGTGVSTGDRSETGIFYLLYHDWDYEFYGASDVTYAIPEPPLCIDAVDVINADSPSASVVSGRVREEFDEWWDVSFTPEVQRDAALVWSWAGPAGCYQVQATGRFTNPGGASPGSGDARIVVVVNGRPFISVSNAGNAGFDTDFSWMQYDGLNDAGAYDEDEDQAPWVVLNTGDTVEVFIISRKQTATTFLFVPLDLESLCFIPDAESPATATCTPSFAFPDEPLGDAWGSPNSWGGQKLVPDEIFTIEGITPYDEGNYSWTVNWTDYDMVALEDGTVYVAVHDSTNDAGTDKHFIVGKKYDPGADDWTQVATLNVNDPDDGHRAEAPSIEYDGTYVYVVWWEADAPGQPSLGNHVQYLWHCVRLDPSDDSTTELGTGQNVYGVVTQIQNYPESNLASDIVCEGNGGDLFVSTVETEDDAAYNNRLIVWRWNGSSWADTSLPAPSDAGSGWRVLGENSFYDVIGAMVGARQAGPVTDGVTLVYSYGDGASDEKLCTIEYEVGVGWGNEILTDLGAVEGDERLYGASAPLAESIVGTSMTLLWSANEGRLLLVVDMLPAILDGIWDVLQMNDAGTQWEPLNQIGPGDMTGQWRQSRNTAAIGPDGEVYRAMMMSTTGFNEFEPKIAKTCAGFGPGFALATNVSVGGQNDPVWWAQMHSTANYRIRIVGQVAYVIAVLYAEEYDPDTDTYTGNVGEGMYVFRLPYSPCDVFVPHIYRLVIDS